MAGKKKIMDLKNWHLLSDIEKVISEKPIFETPSEFALVIIFLQIQTIANKCEKRICEETNWGHPTFYRKLKKIKTDNFDNSESKEDRILSNADLRAILNVYSGVSTESRLIIDKVKQKCSNNSKL